MKFEELQQLLGDQVVFRTGTLMAGQSSPEHLRRQLTRWVKAGKVLSLRRGVYVLASPYAKSHPHPFVLANALRRASYVSLQSALAWYGCIPEFSPTTTSVTTERPERLQTPMGRFLFRHLRQDLFREMRRVEVSAGQYALVATPEKALVDLLYLTPHSDEEGYLDELRLESRGILKKDRLLKTAEATESGKVIRAVGRLERLFQEEWGEPL
ncbi:MAG: hypothetical protein ACLFUF_05940 [Opitutales bacterium]